MSDRTKNQGRNDHAGAPAAPRMGSVLLSLAILSGFLGVIVAGSAQMAAPVIKANRVAMLDAAVRSVLPRGVRMEVFGYALNGVVTNPEGAGFGQRFYASFDGDGSVIGLAMEATARGDGGVADIIVGYDPIRKVVAGVYVLESREMPGSGYPVGTWPNFEEPNGVVDSHGFAVMMDQVLQRSLPRVIPCLDTLRKAPS